MDIHEALQTAGQYIYIGFRALLEGLQKLFGMLADWFQSLPWPNAIKLFSNDTANKYLFFGIAIYLLLMNIWAFALFGADKSNAKRKQRRIKESKLMKVCFFGGATGGIIGMNESEKDLNYLVNGAFVGRQLKNVATNRFAGGIIGNQNNATTSDWNISYCINYGTIYCYNSHYSGGIMGQWTGSGGTIEKCVNYGMLQTTYATNWIGASGGIMEIYSKRTVRMVMEQMIVLAFSEMLRLIM